MLNYIIRQFFYSVSIILGVMTVTFGIIRVLPGDPARLMMGQRADVQSVEELRKQWKLDKPIFPDQYFDFMSRAMTGDLGRSFSFNRPVTETILEKAPATALLAFTSLIIASFIGIAIGVVSAWKPYTALDNASLVGALFGISVPVFVLGILLVVFTSWLGIFPGVGYVVKRGSLQMQYLLLPMIALAARPLSIIARITRSSMLEVLGQDYIRTARAKGLPIRTTILKHALRNALNPVITTISAWLAGTLAGTLFIEQIFYWPGVGQLAYDAVRQLDFPMIQGTVLFIAVTFVVINFIVDIIYSVLDPKVRLR
jgi:peptide/nickel transport system permease protein